MNTMKSFVRELKGTVGLKMLSGIEWNFVIFCGETKEILTAWNIQIITDLGLGLDYSHDELSRFSKFLKSSRSVSI